MAGEERNLLEEGVAEIGDRSEQGQLLRTARRASLFLLCGGAVVAYFVAGGSDVVPTSARQFELREQLVAQKPRGPNLCILPHSAGAQQGDAKRLLAKDDADLPHSAGAQQGDAKRLLAKDDAYGVGEVQLEEAMTLLSRVRGAGSGKLALKLQQLLFAQQRPGMPTLVLHQQRMQLLQQGLMVQQQQRALLQQQAQAQQCLQHALQQAQQQQSPPLLPPGLQHQQRQQLQRPALQLQVVLAQQLGIVDLEQDAEAPQDAAPQEEAEAPQEEAVAPQEEAEAPQEEVEAPQQ